MNYSDDLLTSEDLKQALEPPSRWTNLYQTLTPITVKCTLCFTEREVEPGFNFGGCCFDFPSKDLAETHAAKDVIAPYLVYLGAFPKP